MGIVQDGTPVVGVELYAPSPLPTSAIASATLPAAAGQGSPRLLRLSRTRRARKEAGFTLIETLVALIVFAVVAVVAQRGMVTVRLGLDRARSTLAAEQVARSLVETELDRIVRAPGVFEGDAGGLQWRITAEPIDLGLPTAPPPPEATAPRQTVNRAETGDAGQTGTPSARAANGAEQGAAPARPAPEEPESKWAMLKVRVSVANGRGAPLTVETLHAVKVGS